MNLDAVGWREGLFGAFLLYLLYVAYDSIVYLRARAKRQANEKPEPQTPVRRPGPSVAPQRRQYLEAAEEERRIAEEAMLTIGARAFPNELKKSHQPVASAPADAGPALKDKKARFDALLAGADAPDPLQLRKLLASDLNLMLREYVVGGPRADTERIAVLIGLTRDDTLWHRLVRYLTDVDMAHRYNQKYSGVSKDDLGPIPSEARSATWVRSEAARLTLPEAMRRRVDEALEELEEAFRGQ